MCIKRSKKSQKKKIKRDQKKIQNKKKLSNQLDKIKATRNRYRLSKHGGKNLHLQIDN